MVKTEYGTFDGDQWEQICKICFYRMFETLNEVYTHIEASPGDDGLEGFTEGGKAFQCYCPDNNYSAEDLHTKIVTKINDDLKKLRDKESNLKKHLGNIKIKVWYLVTPEIRKKEIIAYCNKKTIEVKNWNLSIIDNNNFKVVVVDINYILPYLKSALEGLNFKIQYNPANQSSFQDIVDYKENESFLVDNVIDKHRKKLAQKGIASNENLVYLTHKTISHNLDGREIVEMWRKDSPKDFEKFSKIIRQEEEDITELCLFPDDNYNQRYEDIKSRVEIKLSQAFTHLDDTTIKDLTNYVISDWLLRCPLKFV